MIPQTTAARSVARSLLEDLKLRPFSGRVLGVFKRACNLIDNKGRVIAVVLPTVGRGPFAISIEGSPGIFDKLAHNGPAQASPQAVVIGQWHISLGNAEIWEPKISRPGRPLDLGLIVDLVKPCTNWPVISEDSSIARRMATLARSAATQLTEAVTFHYKSKEQFEEAVSQLAGLGSGLTPAGDDYLIGTMAAFWLTGEQDLIPVVAETAIPKTNSLSAAFLKAAAKGEFIEPWHSLAIAWEAEDKQALVESIERITDFGMSSGMDALAGFANTLLGLAHKAVPPNR